MATRAPRGRQGVVGAADEVHLLLQIPIVENHPHRDEVRLGQRVFEEIAGGCVDAIARPDGGNGVQFVKIRVFRVFRDFRGKNSVPEISVYPSISG